MTMLYIILGLVVAFCFVTLKAESIYVYNDGVRIKDNFYPLIIPNDAIISISLLNRAPRIIMKSNGANFVSIIKGKCKIRRDETGETESARLYLRNRKSQVIEIKTVNGSVFINRKNDALTQELFDEMKNTVKIVKESELDYCYKPKGNYRSIIITIAFVAVMFVPILFMNYSNEIIVNDDVIEIKGDYAMDIPLSDVDTVLLVESLPAIKLRTNGISTRKVNIGNFKTDDGDKCHLYINNDVPLFIEIRCQKANDESQKSLIFINKTTVEETKSLFEEIFDSKYN